jgi:hypothetical protein
MARFYLDHNVAHGLARLLNERGHDATTALAEHTTRLRDGAHLLHTSQASRIIVTHNQKDFVELHHAWALWTDAWNVADRHSGIVVLPHIAGWNVYRIAGELEVLVHAHESLLSRLLRWTPASGWIEE